MRKLNDEFSNQLPNSNNKVLQIATDCVFSGREGNYTEFSIKEPLDVYGKTKLAGENLETMNIRCSIIGPDVKSSSLFEWIRTQPNGATIQGYTDHYWNGVTTKVFAKLLKGIIETNSWQSGTFHFVPKDSVSKFELVSLIAKRLGRSDLKVVEKETGNKVDRTLATNFPDLNQNLWKLAGYSEIPTIEQMVNDISL
jgi:dTDP-4-dehydrorhamnose reductase